VKSAKFIDYFKAALGHQEVPSSSLVRRTTHAALYERGMVQFKRVFQGWNAATTRAR